MFIFYLFSIIPFISSFELRDFPNVNISLIDGTFNNTFTHKIDSSKIYVFPFYDNSTTLILPPIITTWSDNASEIYPLLVVVQQQTSIVSWQIPMFMGSEEFSLRKFQKTSRTLCPRYYNESSPVEKLREEYFTVMISCSSPVEIEFNLLAYRTDFFIELNKPIEVEVAPAESRFYSFRFPDNMDSALLQLTSDSDICMSLSIQNFSCPVYDQEDDLKYRGYWETVTTKGGMMLSKEAFPQRLFVVFVVHADDKDCTGNIESTITDRHKVVRFTIKPSISYKDYLLAMISVITAFAIIYIVTLCLALRRPKTRGEESRSFINNDDDDDNSNFIDHNIGDVIVYSQVSVCNINDTNPIRYIEDSDIQGLRNAVLENVNQVSRRPHITRRPSLQVYLSVYDLSREAHQVLKAKSNLYFWNLLTIAVFYSLPVVQLVFTYQKVLNDSGNQDLCYYNFLCSHHLGVISDFNHIFSNCAYVLFGILFLLIVYSREITIEEKRETGIPQHYGLYYTLGASLIMEGVMSACYHICPNHSNFQFDTSFMYILVVISMIKIYQSRHPDINASAYLAFGVLAFLIFMGMFGVLSSSKNFYYCFTVIHVLLCLFLTAQIYYMGEWNLGCKGRFFMIVTTPVVRNEELNRWWRPLYPSRLVLLIIGNMCNWALIYVRLYDRLGDFATYLLAILMSNLLLYFIFYCYMKYFSGERIKFNTLLYILASLVCWSISIYFFIHKSISWKLTPAESRTYNQPCVLLNFFDRHDIWHFMSATSMFFSFMVLLTLDDDVKHVHRTEIPVF